MTISEAVVLGAPTEAADWRAMFRSIESEGAVPSASEQIIERERALFRSMYVDLAEARDAIAASRLQPPLVTIYADVLNIPDSTTWLLQSAALVIIARRVQIGATASIAIDFGAGSASSFVFFADQVEGSLKVVASMNGAPQAFRIAAPPAQGGVQIRLVDGAAREVPLPRAKGLPMMPTQELRRAFTTEFLFAALLFDQQPRIALAMLAWLQAWTGFSSDLLDLFLRTAALLTHLAGTVDAEKNGAAFVPYLSRAVYTELAGAFVREAQQFESEYRTLSTHRVVNEQFIELAKRLAANQVFQAQYVEKVIEQAKANYEHAMNAVTASERNFARANQNVQMLQADFDHIGVPEFRRQAILGAVVNLASAIVTFAVGIGATIATSGATGGAAAGAGVDAAKKVAETAQAGSEVAKQAQKSGDIMARLKKVGEGLGKLFTFGQKLVEVAGKIHTAAQFAETMREMNLAGLGAELTATHEWEIFKLTTDDAMKEPIEKGVGFASELRIAVASLAIYGQAVVGARLAAVSAGQQYANALLQRELARQQQRNLDEYVQKLKAGDAPIAEMMQQLYQRYLDVKSSLYTALLGYRAAYAYWALRPSHVQPRILDPVDAWDTGLRDLTRISLDHATAVNSFKPAPQELVHKRIAIDDPRVLEALRSTGRATWNIPLGAPELADFDRVRLRRVRVWLESARPDASGSVTLVLSTAGSYRDRLRGIDYHFAAEPLKRQLQYRVSASKPLRPDWEFADGTFGTMEVDGAVDDEVRFAYFEPTAFAQWEVKGGRGTDLSGVTRITMEVSGTIMTNLVMSRTS